MPVSYTHLYEFLRSAIQKYYAGHGVELDMAEIFVSDGAKSDLGNLLDLFDVDNTCLLYTSEPKQGQRSQSARGFCPRSTMRVPQPDIIEHFGNADAVPQPPERCLSR